MVRRQEARDKGKLVRRIYKQEERRVTGCDDLYSIGRVISDSVPAVKAQVRVDRGK